MKKRNVIIRQGCKELLDDIESDLINIECNISDVTDLYACHFLLYAVYPLRAKIQTKSNFIDTELIDGKVYNSFDGLDTIDLSIEDIIEKEKEILEKYKNVKFKDIDIISINQKNIKYEDNMINPIDKKELTYNNQKTYIDAYEEYNENLRVIDSYIYYKKVFNKIIEIAKQYKNKMAYIDLGQLAIVCVFLIQRVYSANGIMTKKLRYISCQTGIPLLQEFIKNIDRSLIMAKKYLIQTKKEYDEITAKL